MTTPLQKAFNAVFLVAIILASLCLAGQLVIISINVILRYFFSSGISWVEEISKDVLMTTFTFLAMAIGVKLDTHINVDLFPKKTPAWVSTALEILKNVMFVGVGLFLTVYGIILCTNIKSRIASVPALPGFVQYIFIPLGGFMILADSIMKLFGLEKGDRSLDERFMGIGGNDGR